MTRFLILMAVLASGAHAATVTDDILTGQVCGDGLVYVGGCPGTGLGTTVYVVGSGGSDSASGLGYSNRWASLTKANQATIPDGADLCGMTDSVFAIQEMTITSDGTEADPAVRAGCYLDAANGGELTRWDHGSGLGRGDRPVIGDETSAACIAGWNCTAFANYGNSSRTRCANEFDATIRSDGARGWLYIIGWHVRYQACRGILIAGTGASASDTGSVHHILVTDNVVEFAGGAQALMIEKGFENFAILRNDIHDKGMCRAQSLATGVDYGCVTLTHGTALLVTNRGRYGLIEDNDVHDSNGEGINAYKFISGVAIRGNRVGNMSSANIYLDGGDGVVESNLSWGNATGTGVYASNRGSGAIKVAIETKDSGGSALPDSSPLVRANIVVASRNGGIEATVFPAAAGTGTNNGPCAVISGAHTGANNASTFVNSSASYTPSALVGYTIKNTTDGGYGVVTANTSTTVTATLGGGSENDWDTGDGLWICSATISAQAYGNTIVGFTNASYGMVFRYGVLSFIGQNNVVYDTAAGAALQCGIQNNAVDPELDHTGWYVNPSAGKCRSGSDVLGDPVLAKTYSQMLLASYANQPTKSWVQPQAGSPLIGAGTLAPVSATCLDMTDFGASSPTGTDAWWWKYATHPFSPSVDSWVRCHPYYFDGTPYDGTIGAVRH